MKAAKFHGCVLGLSTMLLTGSLWAQDMRDPTAVPYSAPPGAAASAPQREGVNASGVVVRNGVPYLVVATRLVGVGQQVGKARLERITETEIWLREGGRLQKIPRYAGIQRQPASAVVAACANTKPVSRKKTTAQRDTASCEGAQP